MNRFDSLPGNIIFEIFSYLSPFEIFQSFLSLNDRFSRILKYEYIWHIYIDENRALLMFKEFCENILKLIGGRVVSLRLTLTNIIGGWSFISSSLKCQQTIFLRRLHLIDDIEPNEFDKLLCSYLIKQLHTLMVDLDATIYKSSFLYFFERCVYVCLL
jgi:hypothetical protein